jgi:hypothetical protein
VGRTTVRADWLSADVVGVLADYPFTASDARWLKLMKPFERFLNLQFSA